MEELYKLKVRSNINVHSFNDKYIIIYDYHRTILNVLFEAKKQNIFRCTPNLIFFDYHDDACINAPKSQLLKRMGVDKLEDATDKQFWSFVEFDLGTLDDDWLTVGMELDLIKNAIVIGAQKDGHIADYNNKYTSEDGNIHELYSIPHLVSSLDNRGCLGDSIIKEPYYQSVRDIIQYHQGHFDYKEDINPFILDFDLDCFTTECQGRTFAWPEMIFVEDYEYNPKVHSFIHSLIEKASLITICREPGCCGGIGESNKILSYLDRYFFEGVLGTFPMR